MIELQQSDGLGAGAAVVDSELIVAFSEQTLFSFRALSNSDASISYGTFGGSQATAERIAEFMEHQRVTLTLAAQQYRLIQNATADIANISTGDGAAFLAEGFIDPLITVAPGFEETFGVAYGEGVIVPEPGARPAALLALVTVASLRRRILGPRRA